MFEIDFCDCNSTVKILDDYENSKEKTLKLDRIVPMFLISNDGNRTDKFRFGLLIEKPKIKKKYINTNIRMTDIKSINKQKTICINSIVSLNELSFGSVPKMDLPAYHFLYRIKEPLVNKMIEIMDEKEGYKTTYKFETPFQLNAQNTNNRTGYGSEYYGEYCVYEGTLYGETSTYVITGFILTNLSNWEY